MIIKVKHETDNPNVYVVENPARQEDQQIDMFAKFTSFRPTLGKSYSALPTHQWETTNRENNDHVLVHFIVKETRAIDDYN